MLFEFLFNLVGKLTMAFPTGQWRIRGRSPGAGPPALFLVQTEAWRAEKNFFGGGAPPPPPPISKGLNDRTSPLSQGLDPALRAIHGAYPNPSTQMEAQSMDFGAVSQIDLTRVTFRLWRRLVRSGSQSKNKICFFTPARGASYLISQVKSS